MSNRQNRWRIRFANNKLTPRFLRASLKRRALSFALVAYLLIMPVPSLDLSGLAERILSDVGDAVTWASKVPLLAEMAFVHIASRRQLLTLSDRLAAVYQIRERQELAPGRNVDKGHLRDRKSTRL